MPTLDGPADVFIGGKRMRGAQAKCDIAAAGERPAKLRSRAELGAELSDISDMVLTAMLDRWHAVSIARGGTVEWFTFIPSRTEVHAPGEITLRGPDGAEVRSVVLGLIAAAGGGGK